MNGKDLNRLLVGGYIMDSETVRYWPRVGMYVTLEFAEEWTKERDLYIKNKLNSLN